MLTVRKSTRTEFFKHTRTKIGCYTAQTTPQYYWKTQSSDQQKLPLSGSCNGLKQMLDF